MNIILKISRIAFLILFLNACSVFTSPLKKPIIEDHSHNGRITTLATIPSRRVVVMSEVNRNYQNKGDENIVFVCAEPPADVSDNILSTLSAAARVKGSVPTSKTQDEISAEYASAIATTAQALFKRTQGIQFYRDGMYNLCQALMNNVIGPKQYAESAASLRNDAVILVALELQYLQHTQPDSVASNMEEDLKNLKEIMEDMRVKIDMNNNNAKPNTDSGTATSNQ